MVPKPSLLVVEDQALLARDTGGGADVGEPQLALPWLRVLRLHRLAVVSLLVLR